MRATSLFQGGWQTKYPTGATLCVVPQISTGDVIAKTPEVVSIENLRCFSLSGNAPVKQQRTELHVVYIIRMEFIIPSMVMGLSLLFRTFPFTFGNTPSCIFPPAR